MKTDAHSPHSVVHTYVCIATNRISLWYQVAVSYAAKPFVEAFRSSILFKHTSTALHVEPWSVVLCSSPVSKHLYLCPEEWTKKYIEYFIKPVSSIETVWQKWICSERNVLITVVYISRTIYCTFITHCIYTYSWK